MTVFEKPLLGTLRLMTDNDLKSVLIWRNTPSVRMNMYTQHEISMEEHTNWWNRTKEQSSQKYLIFEDSGQPLGVVAFNNINTFHKNSSWAFYASPEAPKGTGSKMEFLALDFAFEKIKLNKLYCEVLAYNQPVLGLHKKFGFTEEGLFREQYYIKDKFVDVHRLAIFSDKWRTIKPELEQNLILKISKQDR